MASEWELAPHPVMPRGKPLLVCILDGWGEFKDDEYNAVYRSNCPTIKSLRNGAPDRWRTIKAHGKAVGLPSDGDMGNSEVGHNAMGAGKVIAQGASLVDDALNDGSLFETSGFNHIKGAWEQGGTLHLMGLLSDGGVHSRYDQVIRVARGAFERGAKRIRFHVLTDGRDVPDGSSLQFVGQLEKDIQELNDKGGDVKIASGGGRMIVSMDRYESNWKIVECGWHAHVLGEAPNKFTSALEALKTLKERDPENVNDQYYPPWVVVDQEGKAVGPVQDGDAFVIWNFRADRVIQLAKAFEYEDFSAFDRVRYPKVKFAGMMQYDGDLKLPTNFLVAPPVIEKTSGQYLVKNGVRTFACSETQKFGHVTFFWNGNRSGKLDDEFETYCEIPSDHVPFNRAPKMKAKEIAEAASEALLSGKYDYVRVNVANGDMVGHTGVFDAVLEACESVDNAVKVMLNAVDQVGGVFLLTADHGNCDDMAQRDKKGLPKKDKEGKVEALTSHTLNPVPFAIGGQGLPEAIKLRQDLPNAGLANVTASIINLLGFEAPKDYEPSLLA